LAASIETRLGWSSNRGRLDEIEKGSSGDGP